MKPNEEKRIQKVDAAAVEKFADLYKAAREKLVDACQYLAEQVALSSDFIEAVHAAKPYISRRAMAAMLRVGSGELHPQLCFPCTPPEYRLARLPLYIQAQVLAAGSVDVAVAADSDDVLRVPLDDLEPEQIQQVFVADGLRSITEQRAWIKQAILRPRGHASADAVVVRKGRLIIGEPCELTLEQVLIYAQQMA